MRAHICDQYDEVTVFALTDTATWEAPSGKFGDIANCPSTSHLAQCVKHEAETRPVSFSYTVPSSRIFGKWVATLISPCVRGLPMNGESRELLNRVWLAEILLTSLMATRKSFMLTMLLAETVLKD